MMMTKMMNEMKVRKQKGKLSLTLARLSGILSLTGLLSEEKEREKRESF